MKKTLSIVLSTIALLAPTTYAADTVVPASERARIETVIQEYLLENPEIIALAIRELQRRQTLAQMLPSIQMYRGYLENDPQSSVMGNPNGDVTIVEFFDYRCGYCRRHFPEVMRLVKEDGNIKLVLKHFPVLDRPNEPALSRKAALAAVAAEKQGKFEAFHMAMMAGTGGITEDYIYNTAQSVGLDLVRLKADMTDKLNEKIITNSLSIGQDIGFSGTPGYVIGNDVVLGAEGHDRLKEAVVRARKEQASS